MADHRQRAERLAAALGLAAEVFADAAGLRVVVLRHAGRNDGTGVTRLATNAATDANGWRWAAEHLAAMAAEAAGPALAAAADEAERARLAEDAIVEAMRAAEREAAEVKARLSGLHRAAREAELAKDAARESLADAIAAATPEQRAAWDALREGGQ